VDELMNETGSLTDSLAMSDALLQGYAELSRLLDELLALTGRLAVEASESLEQTLHQRQALLHALTARDPAGLFHRTASCHGALLSAGHPRVADALQQAQERVRMQFTHVQEAEEAARTALEDARDSLLALLKTHAQRQAMKRYVISPTHSAPRFLDGMR
jgi:4-hydroxyphenylpyruvate dioxygenase-like putative hemolysin